MVLSSELVLGQFLAPGWLGDGWWCLKSPCGHRTERLSASYIVFALAFWFSVLFCFGFLVFFLCTEHLLVSYFFFCIIRRVGFLVLVGSWVNRGVVHGVLVGSWVVGSGAGSALGDG